MSPVSPDQDSVEQGARLGGGESEVTLQRTSWLRERLEEQVDHADASVPLAWQVFITGMIDALLYHKTQVWVGFQTGNMVQFSGNVAQYIIPGSERYPLLTLERILSVLAFFLGSFFGALGGRTLGDRRRIWLILTSSIQSVVLWIAAAILLSRPEDEDPTFRYTPVVLVCSAFAMGMQSIQAQKIVSPAFATTVAFTATLSQIASDPYLFALHPSKTVKGRNRRLIAIVSLCIGGGIGESFLLSPAGLRGGMAVVAGLRLIQAGLWLVPKASVPAPAK